MVYSYFMMEVRFVRFDENQSFMTERSFWLYGEEQYFNVNGINKKQTVCCDRLRLTALVRPGPVVRNFLFKTFMVHILFWNFWYSLALNDNYFIGRRKCWWVNLVISIPRFYWVGQLFFGEFLNHWNSNIIDIRFWHILFGSSVWARVTFKVKIEW